MKLLEKRRAEIEGFPQRTFRYGSTDRHQVCAQRSHYTLFRL